MGLTDIERRVRDAAWPAPSPDLRARVMAGAPAFARRITWSDRVWFSRTWRLGMTAAALVLVGLNQWSGSRATAGRASTPQAMAEAQVIEEASRQAGLPVDAAASLARRAIVQTRPRRIDLRSWPALETFDAPGYGR